MNGQSKFDIIIERLRRIEDNQLDHGEKIYDIHGRMSKVEVKASVFGLFGGAFVALIAFLRGH